MDLTRKLDELEEMYDSLDTNSDMKKQSIHVNSSPYQSSAITQQSAKSLIADLKAKAAARINSGSASSSSSSKQTSPTKNILNNTINQNTITAVTSKTLNSKTSDSDTDDTSLRVNDLIARSSKLLRGSTTSNSVHPSVSGAELSDDSFELSVDEVNKKDNDIDISDDSIDLNAMREKLLSTVKSIHEINNPVSIPNAVPQSYSTSSDISSINGISMIKHDEQTNKINNNIQPSSILFSPSTVNAHLLRTTDFTLELTKAQPTHNDASSGVNYSGTNSFEHTNTLVHADNSLLNNMASPPPVSKPINQQVKVDNSAPTTNKQPEIDVPTVTNPTQSITPQPSQTNTNIINAKSAPIVLNSNATTSHTNDTIQPVDSIDTAPSIQRNTYAQRKAAAITPSAQYSALTTDLSALNVESVPVIDQHSKVKHSPRAALVNDNEIAQINQLQYDINNNINNNTTHSHKIPQLPSHSITLPADNNTDIQLHQPVSSSQFISQLPIVTQPAITPAPMISIAKPVQSKLSTVRHSLNSRQQAKQNKNVKLSNATKSPAKQSLRVQPHSTKLDLTKQFTALAHDHDIMSLQSTLAAEQRHNQQLKQQLIDIRAQHEIERDTAFTAAQQQMQQLQLRINELTQQITRAQADIQYLRSHSKDVLYRDMIAAGGIVNANIMTQDEANKLSDEIKYMNQLIDELNQDNSKLTAKLKNIRSDYGVDSVTATPRIQLNTSIPLPTTQANQNKQPLSIHQQDQVNQQLISKDKQIIELKQQLEWYVENQVKIDELQSQTQHLSSAQLITKPTNIVPGKSVSELSRQVESLQHELIQRDQQHELRVRGLKQEHDQMKLMYEKRINGMQQHHINNDNNNTINSSNTADTSTMHKNNILNVNAKRVEELEEQIDNLREYYQNKIKLLQQSHHTDPHHNDTSVQSPPSNTAKKSLIGALDSTITPKVSTASQLPKPHTTLLKSKQLDAQLDKLRRELITQHNQRIQQLQAQHTSDINKFKPQLVAEINSLRHQLDTYHQQLTTASNDSDDTIRALMARVELLESEKKTLHAQYIQTQYSLNRLTTQGNHINTITLQSKLQQAENQLQHQRTEFDSMKLELLRDFNEQLHTVQQQYQHKLDHKNQDIKRFQSELDNLVHILQQVQSSNPHINNIENVLLLDNNNQFNISKNLDATFNDTWLNDQYSFLQSPPQKQAESIKSVKQPPNAYDNADTQSQPITNNKNSTTSTRTKSSSNKSGGVKSNKANAYKSLQKRAEVDLANVDIDKLISNVKLLTSPNRQTAKTKLLGRK